jgi:hypothetical protein
VIDVLKLLAVSGNDVVPVVFFFFCIFCDTAAMDKAEVNPGSIQAGRETVAGRERNCLDVSFVAVRVRRFPEHQGSVMAWITALM